MITISTLQIKKLTLDRFSDLPKDAQWKWDLKEGLSDSKGCFYFPPRPKTDSVNTRATAQGSGVQRWLLPPELKCTSEKEKGESHYNLIPGHTACVLGMFWHERHKLAGGDYFRSRREMRFAGSPEVTLMLQANSNEAASWGSFPLNVRPEAIQGVCY